MPQLTLEYTSNIKLDIETSNLFPYLHTLLVDKAKAKLKDCKSRWAKLDNYLVGEGSLGAGFIYLQIQLIKGRSAEVRKEIGRKACQILEEAFQTEIKRAKPQIRVQIKEIDADFYFSSSLS